MAGRPKRRLMIQALQRRAIEELGDPDNPDAPTPTPLDYAEDWVASGRSILALAKELSAELGIDLSREQLSKYLNACEEGAEARLARARARAGHALVEGSVELADTVAEDRNAIQKAKLQVQTRQWLAERYNREELGTQAGQMNVAISLNGAHLTALRERQATATALPQLEAETVEADVEVLQ